MTSLKKVSIILIVLLIFNIFYPIIAEAAETTISIQFEDERVYRALKTNNKEWGQKYRVKAYDDTKIIVFKNEVIAGTHDIEIDGNDGGTVTKIGGLEKFTELESLRLKNNKKPIEDLKLLSNFKKLKILDLANNGLGDDAMTIIGQLTSLELLTLNNNNITNISELRNLKNLQTLTLDHNKIKDISVMSNFTKLKGFNLSYNCINDITTINRFSDKTFPAGNYLHHQTVTTNEVTNKSTINLPAIFQQALDKNGSVGYISDYGQYDFGTGCKLADSTGKQIVLTKDYEGKEGNVKFSLIYTGTPPKEDDPDTDWNESEATRYYGLSDSTFTVKVDKKNPTITIDPSLDEIKKTRNKPLTVTAKVSEQVTLKNAPEGWKLQDDKKTITKTFDKTQKGTETITVADAAGNETSQKITVDIDMTGPTFTDPTYTITADGAIVSTVASKPIDGKNLPDEDWKLDPQTQKILKKLYTGNIKETLTFKDKIGNAGTLNVDVNCLTPAKVTNMTITPTTGKANKKKVTITFDEPIKALIKIGDKEVTKDWTFLSDRQITREYTSDTTEEIKVYRAQGGVETKQKIEVTEIDSEKPKISSIQEIGDNIDGTYSTIYITFNEDLSEETNQNMINDGWFRLANKYVKIFYENGSKNITVQDEAGNESTLSFEVTKVQEKEFAVKECINSPDKLTKENVTVTITVNKIIDKEKLPTDWKPVEGSNKSITKTYTGNAEEMVKIYSLQGKGKEWVESHVVVDYIDKDPLESDFEVLCDGSDHTSLRVIIIPNKEIEPIDGWERVDYNGKCTYEKKYYKNVGLQEIKIKDKVGNEDTVRFIVENISEEEFRVKKIDYSTEDLTKDNVIVTVTVNKDIDKRYIPTGWQPVEGSAKSITKTYTGNENNTITIRSVSNETIHPEVKINNIDKTPLKVEIKTSPEGPTKGTVRKTIEGNRKINDIRRLGTK